MEYIPPYSIGTDSLSVIAHALFYSSPKHSLLEDERFQELMQSPAEATAWINHTPGGEPGEEGLTGALLALPLIQGEGNKTAVHVFFPNGNIECKATEYLHPSWTEQIDPSSAPLITEEIINRIPSDMATVLIGLSLPPNAWPTWVRLKGLAPFLEKNIQENNSFMDGLADLSKGILLLAMAEVTDSIQLKQGKLSFPPRKVMLGGNASDQPSNNELFPTTADQRTLPSFARELTYKDRRNGWFAAGSDPAAVSSFLSPKDNVHPYAKKGAGHHFFLFANLAALSPPRRIEENNLSRRPWKTLTVQGVFKGKGQLQLSALLE